MQRKSLTNKQAAQRTPLLKGVSIPPVRLLQHPRDSKRNPTFVPADFQCGRLSGRDMQFY
jgi:hypothetical protein